MLSSRFAIQVAAILAPWTCYAALSVQQLVQVPAEPGQQIANLQTDLQGNLVVSALVQPGGTSPFGVVKKVSPAGVELFRVVLPGVATTLPALAIDSNDDIYLAGLTDTSSAFPFTHDLTTKSSEAGTFLVKLKGHDGSQVYATRWGYGDLPGSILVDRSGQALVTLSTFSSQLSPTPGAYASPPGPGNLTSPMYLVRFTAAGDGFVFAARYGGQTSVCTSGSSCAAAAQTTDGSAILLDGQGNIWVAGNTNTTDLPLTATALKKACGCSQYSGDAFLAEFSGDGSRLLYATYFGTTPIGSIDGDDQIISAAADSAGRIWLVGATNGTDLPVTPDAVQRTLITAVGKYGATNGFILAYDPAANKLAYATYFGGGGVEVDPNDAITNIQFGPGGAGVFAGQTHAPSLPVAPGGFTRGSGFVGAVDPSTFAITALTTFPFGMTGAGLALAAGNTFVISGPSNVAAFVKTDGGAAAPGLYAVTSAAGDAATGQIAPSEIIALYGAGIGPAAPASADFSSGQAPTQLGGIQVLMDGAPVPLLYAQNDQVNAIVPFGLANSTTHIVVRNNGTESNGAVFGVVPAQPDAFRYNAKQWAAVLNQDGTVNSANNHAALGSVVAVYATGFGAMQPPPTDGQIITGALPSLTLPVKVLYNGQPLEVTYAGPAPMLVAGAIQVNFRLPAFTGTSEPGFQFSVGDWLSGGFVVLVK